MKDSLKDNLIVRKGLIFIAFLSASDCIFLVAWYDSRAMNASSASFGDNCLTSVTRLNLTFGFFIKSDWSPSLLLKSLLPVLPMDPRTDPLMGTQLDSVKKWSSVVKIVSSCSSSCSTSSFWVRIEYAASFWWRSSFCIPSKNVLQGILNIWATKNTMNTLDLKNVLRNGSGL